MADVECKDFQSFAIVDETGSLLHHDGLASAIKNLVTWVAEQPADKAIMVVDRDQRVMLHERTVLHLLACLLAC